MNIRTKIGKKEFIGKVKADEKMEGITNKDVSMVSTKRSN